MNKKAIELSMNFIIILIVSIVVFGLGLKFAYDAFYKAEKIMEMTQNDLDQRVERLLCTSSDLVCVGENSKKINRGDYAVFSVSVFNALNDQTDFTLTVDICPLTVLGGADGGVTRTIAPNQYTTFGVGIMVDKNTHKDTYSCPVSVAYDGSVYGTTQILYVTVP